MSKSRAKPYVDRLVQPTLEDYGVVLEQLVEAISAERGCFYLEREREFLYRGDELLRERFPFSRQAVDSVLDEGRSFLCLDAANDRRVRGSGSIAINSVRSVLCAAARDSDGTPLVVAYFDNRGTTGCFSEASLELLRDVLALVPGAVPEVADAEPPLAQVGVLAWQDEKLALSKTESGSWMVPRAALEAGVEAAMESMGVAGEVEQEPIGSFLRFEKGLNYRVELFALANCTTVDDWSGKRTFFEAQEASEMVEDPGLRTLILRNAAQRPGWTGPEPLLPYFSKDYDQAVKEYLKPFADLMEDPSEENLGLALELLMEELFAERGCLWFGDEESLIYRGDEGLRTEFPFSTQVVNQALETGHGFVSFDTQGDKRLNPTSSLETHGIRSVLCTAARDENGEVLVVVYFDNSSSGGYFSDKDLKLLDQVMSLYPAFITR